MQRRRAHRLARPSRALSCHGTHGLRQPQGNHVRPGATIVDRELQAARRTPCNEVGDDELPDLPETLRGCANVDLALALGQNTLHEHFEIPRGDHATMRLAYRS